MSGGGGELCVWFKRSFVLQDSTPYPSGSNAGESHRGHR